MEKIETAGTQSSLKSRETERSEGTLEVSGMEAPLEMAEIVRVFNAEKKARGWKEESVPARNREGTLEVSGMEAPLEMAEIVRVFNTEKKARGWKEGATAFRAKLRHG